MPDLRWTTEPPTEAGWYWVRWVSPRGGKDEAPDVVLVLVTQKDGPLHYEEAEGSWLPIVDVWTEWSGPIPEPTDTPPTTGGEGKNR